MRPNSWLQETEHKNYTKRKRALPFKLANFSSIILFLKNKRNSLYKGKAEIARHYRVYLYCDKPPSGRQEQTAQGIGKVQAVRFKLFQQ